MSALTANQRAALRVLRREFPAPISPAEVARWGDMLPPSSVRAAFIALERRGLAERIGPCWVALERAEP
jgi:hypothetical protein